MNKFLIIGLGSMGRRRIRCLKTLGYNNIFGYDINSNRLKAVSKEYNIQLLNKINKSNLDEFDAIIISTPPDSHTYYLRLAILNKIPVFVEASVLIDDLENLNKLSIDKRVLVAPSTTMTYHPLIKIIRSVINNKKYGRVLNFSYHSGQYLPDWHPWEDIKDFYVSNKSTGGCREIVPFELTWICDILGIPNEVKGFFSKNSNLDIDIDDTYCFALKYSNFIASVTIDVVSRDATRHLILNLEEGQIVWNWNDKKICIYDAKSKKWLYHYQSKGSAEKGYNKNIIEEMYIDELQAFIDACKGKSLFNNNLKKDIEILKLLNKIEDSDGGFDKK